MKRLALLAVVLILCVGCYPKREDTISPDDPRVPKIPKQKDAPKGGTTTPAAGPAKGGFPGAPAGGAGVAGTPAGGGGFPGAPKK